MENERGMKKIIFVYNADSGIVSGIKDFFHKIVKPSTYECRLCFVSYDNFGMRKPWKDYIESLPFPTEFLHRDEFASKYPGIQAVLPAAFWESDGKISLLIDANEMNAVTNLRELIDLTNSKIRLI
jgi:hypothetical protein